jgi:hypothetical protein
MFATELKADSIDLLVFRNVGRWVALAWWNDLFPPPMGVPYGTHLASYILALPELEIRETGQTVVWSGVTTIPVATVGAIKAKG